jgi:hypothetical protein
LNSNKQNPKWKLKTKNEKINRKVEKEKRRKGEGLTRLTSPSIPSTEPSNEAQHHHHAWAWPSPGYRFASEAREEDVVVFIFAIVARTGGRQPDEEGHVPAAIADHALNDDRRRPYKYGEGKPTALFYSFSSP